jgi:trigger factor
MQQISGPIFEDKVIDFILEMVKITDVVIDTDTLYKVDEEVEKPTKKSATKKSATKKSATKKSATKKSATKKSATKKSAPNKVIDNT